MPYEKIIMSGKGYISTEALGLLSQHNRNLILLLSFALTPLGLTIGSYMASLEGFQMIVSFVVFPLFFLSEALFPLDRPPLTFDSNCYRSCYI